ncbi:hypothetical protein TSAR_009829 [Trichomalopsis sarcophagae]|uniref:Uncharacterized protein n=1 Tax=Trichomalopsis sarcophagae TaxID=543379 RepID=A0A232EK72_9HYME|nr:hypothetical protein TSAR_009829 [Trichomalopsis sarcophagae]
MPDLKVHKDLSLSLILYHRSDSEKNDFRKLFNTLFSYSKIDQISPRPRCFYFNNAGTLDFLFNSVLEESWNLRFLDVTVIEVVLSSNSLGKNAVEDVPYIYSYNPFYKIFIKRYFNVSATIFPDKLVDLNGSEFWIHVPYVPDKDHKLDYTKQNNTVVYKP